MARDTYDHKEIEQRARAKWKELGLYTADLTDETKEKYYLLFEFPYPSGDLHIGHWYAFALTDIYARKLRMEGKNVLFPMGFDAFGLPAENAAIKNGLDPKKWTYENMDRMRAQIETMGASMDWSKEVVTCDPSYYKWTQWLFTKLYEHGLAERKNAPVKWCPHDKTVLANEQVIDGKCERCGHEVEEKNLTQWFLKITQYAERLLADLDGLPWAQPIKDAQRAWIGKSDGMLFTSPVKDTDLTIETFSAHFEAFRADTFVVIAPDHPRLKELVAGTPDEDRILAGAKRMIDARVAAGREGVKELEGIFTGRYIDDPVGNGELPIWVANYALADYGTGIVKCSAHDERDFAFAQKYDIPLKEVMEPLFIRTIGSDAVRPHEPMVERNAVVAVVKHWSEDKYLCLRWKSNDWTGFVIGGIEEGEDPAITGAREIIEETGYKNPRFVRQICGTTHSQFYHEVKHQNRFAHFTPLYYELADGERDEPSAEELAIHSIEWISKEDIDAFLSRDNDIAYIWDKFSKPPFPWTDMAHGILAEPDEFKGRVALEAREDIRNYLEEKGLAVRKTSFKVRDWSVGRQRYWGCPIPMVYDPEGNPHPVPPEHLPWLLPEDVDFTPGAAGEGMSPLASSTELKGRVVRIFGEGWTPEYDTLDTFVDSSWYFLRYLDPKDDHDFSDQMLMKNWMPVDRYSGGSEHTTMHLLYARFLTKVLYDLALCPVQEPFIERFNRGLIMGPDGQKMSKSKGNVVNPDEVVAKYGADAVRMYLAFIGPYNEPGNYPWNLDGALAMRRFLDRVYSLFERMDGGAPAEETRRALAVAVKKVSEDIDRFKYNTAIAALMVLVRELEALPRVPREAQRTLLLLLAPFAPHIAEELWRTLGEEGSVHVASWPVADAALLEASEALIAIQVNGKKRGEVLLPQGTDEATAFAAARALPAVEGALEGKEPQRIIYVPGRILNLVI